MSPRGRDRTPKSLSPSPPPRRRSYSRSPRRASTSGAAVPKGSNGGSEQFKVIVVSGLSKNVMIGHLEEIFGEYGRITGIDLPLFKVSGLNRGKAAIEFENPDQAERAVKHMDKGQLDGSSLVVQISEHPLPPPQPSPAPRRRSDYGSRSRSPPRRKRSISRSRSPSPRRGGASGYRRRSYSRSPPRFRGQRDSFGGPGRDNRDGRDSRNGYGGGPSGRGGYGRGPGGRGGAFAPGPGAGGQGGWRRERSPAGSVPLRKWGAPAPAARRASPEYTRGGRSVSGSRSPSRSLSPRPRGGDRNGKGKDGKARRASYSSRSDSRSRSRSRSPVRRKRYSPSRSRSRSMSIDSNDDRGSKTK